MEGLGGGWEGIGQTERITKPGGPGRGGIPGRGPVL
jgi:hypothetical protein